MSYQYQYHFDELLFCVAASYGWLYKSF